MNKRLERHKRQVLRAKERMTLSQPDVRTPEQLKLARAERRNDRPAELLPRAVLRTGKT